jgi:CheY-like chemotaxis protein
VNPALADMYGFGSPDHLISGLTDISKSLYVDPRRRAEFVAEIEKYGSVRRFESQVYRRDNSIIWISENARPVRDDNDFMRDLVSSMLKEIGFHDIVHAKDGESALKQTMGTGFDLIVCDIDMEPVDGLTFVEKLRRHAPPPPPPQTPVIMLTAHSDAPLVQRAVKAGVNAYVVKPVKRAQLEARIVTVFDKLVGG